MSTRCRPAAAPRARPGSIARPPRHSVFLVDLCTMTFAACLSSHLSSASQFGGIAALCDAQELEARLPARADTPAQPLVGGRAVRGAALALRHAPSGARAARPAVRPAGPPPSLSLPRSELARLLWKRIPASAKEARSAHPRCGVPHAPPRALRATPSSPPAGPSSQRCGDETTRRVRSDGRAARLTRLRRPSAPPSLPLPSAPRSSRWSPPAPTRTARLRWSCCRRRTRPSL